MSGQSVPPDTRDEVVDFVTRLAEKTELPVRGILRWLQLQPGKFYSWRERYGCANEHNGKIPRDHWIEAWEKEEIIRFRAENPLEGYRRLAFMMIDADRVAVSPATVYRVLRSEGLLDRWNRKPSNKGTGFHQPKRPPSTGASTLPMSTPGEPSTTGARSSTATRASSFTGKSDLP